MEMVAEQTMSDEESVTASEQYYRRDHKDNGTPRK
jgi:hypothetical protein